MKVLESKQKEIDSLKLKYIDDTILYTDDSAEIPSTKDDKIKKRDKWTNDIDFLFACIGFAIGI
jgi:hypothetical protein